MASGGRRKVPRTCLGYADTPCPTQADVWTKHAHRCRSCAALHHMTTTPKRGSVKRGPEWVPTKRKADAPYTPHHVTFDPEPIRRAMTARGITHAEVEKSLGWGSGSLAHAIERRRIGYYRLDELACWLGTYVEELVA